MDTKFRTDMLFKNTVNSKTYDPHRLLINTSDKKKLKQK